MKKIILLFLIVCVVTPFVNAQPGANDITFNPGTGASSNVRAIATQNDGKIIIGGDFTSYNGTTRNRIARLNSDGTLDVTFNPGTGANFIVFAIAIQSDGKIIIGGDFTSYNGTTRNRIARLNADGTLDLTFNPGTGADAFVSSIAIQSDGKIIIGGNFPTYNGIARYRIARLNTNGTLDGAFNTSATTGANSTVYASVIQSDGKIFIGGAFTTYNVQPRNRIARMNTDGAIDLSFFPGTGASSSVSAIAIQSDGKIIIVGNFTAYNGTARNFIARLNTDGTLDLTFDPGTGASAAVNAIAIQSDGKIIIGGNFTSYNGTGRNFIARLNTNGTLDGVFNPGTGANSIVFAIAIQSDGKIIIGGDFTSYNGTPRNRITRIQGGECETAIPALTMPVACVNTVFTNISHTTTEATGIGMATGLPPGLTAVWGANTITINGTPTVSGTFNYSIPLTGGCGTESATGTIIVAANTIGTDVINACDSYTWIDNLTYTSSNNTATFVLPSSTGCDSTVTLNLTINNSSTTTDVISACDSYTWIDNLTYTSSNNTATFVLPSSTGCDSTVTLDLTITPLPGINVTQSSSTLTVSQTGAIYQWLDCDDNNTIINGETNQSYTPIISGNYAVEVTLNGCADTSNCFLIDVVGLSELYSDVISIYPNPASDYLTIKGLDKVKNLKGLEITTLIGETVFQIESLNEEIDISKLPSGLYFLNIVYEKGIETIRFVKQ